MSDASTVRARRIKRVIVNPDALAALLALQERVERRLAATAANAAA